MTAQMVVQGSDEARAVSDLPCVEHVENDPLQGRVVDVRRHDVGKKRPLSLGRLLLVPVRQLEKKGAFRVARISPAKRRIREIL